MDVFKFERNGKEICISSKCDSIMLGDNRYFIDVLCDITNLDRHLNETLKSVITKSEMLNRVSAEFKKTLENVRTSTVSLMQQYPEEIIIARIIKLIAESFDKLEDVQDYAGIEAGLVDVEEMPFDIVSEIQKLADKYHVEIVSKGLELQIHYSPSCIRNVVGDSNHFRHILNELLRNAVRFTEKGYIRISLETSELQGEKIMLKCYVDDTGTGMSHDKIKSLSTLDINEMHEGDTIGLGIIIVKKIIDMMGGSLHITSPSPISTNRDTPGMQFNFSIVFYAEQHIDKKLDYSSIVSWHKVNVLIIISEAKQMPYLTGFLKRKGVRPDIYTLNKESDDMLIQKLVIDRNRYQLVVIAAEKNEKSFSIAEKINREKLTNNCIYAFVDFNSKKGNYIRAKSLNMDYYVVKSNYVAVYESIFKTHFPNLVV
jgi:nitrogen-specific signal transduction histidine kinase